MTPTPAPRPVAVLLLLTAAALAPIARSAPGADPVHSPVLDERVVHLGGRRVTVDELPEHLGEAARSTVEDWAAWAEAGEGRYELTLDPSARVLLVARKGGSKLRSELKLVEEVLGWCDARFPAPAPRDPDLPPSSATQGYTGDPLPDHLPVLVLADGDEDLGAVLEHLAVTAPHLAAWVGEAKGQNGFVLPLPLVGAYLTKGRKLEEWSPDHELLNRLTRLLLLQRHGRLPEWLSQGLAWEMEWEHGGGIWSYARRDGFVYAAEHDSWDDRLRRAFDDRKDAGLTAAELTGLTRAGFDADAALVAWGAAAFLARHHAERMPQVLERLEQDRRQGSRRDLGNGRWTYVPDHETAPERQLAILCEVLGEDAPVQLVRFFVKGKSYRP